MIMTITSQGGLATHSGRRHHNHILSNTLLMRLIFPTMSLPITHTAYGDNKFSFSADGDNDSATWYFTTHSAYRHEMWTSGIEKVIKARPFNLNSHSLKEGQR